MNRNRKVILIAALAVLSAAGATWYWISRTPRDAMEPASTAGTRAQKDDREVLYWYDPMYPDERFDEPGKSPFMDMQLVPKYADEGTERDVVRIHSAVTQNMNLRTARAERTTLHREIHAYGEIDYDETRISQVHTRVAGWIERLAVRATGDPVRAGEVLFELYSPDLVNAQEELLQAVRAGGEASIAGARERLLALGVASAQTDEIIRQRRARQFIPILARQDGVVKALNVREGMYVTPGTEVMSLVDLSSVWVIADVFERQLDWLSPGDRAEVHVSFLPGSVLDGVVDYIYPALNRKTRTVPVRLRFDNAEGLLKPGMYVRALIHAQPREDILTVPSEAVIRTGRMDRVIVHLGEGRFRAHEVRLGAVADDRIEILAGLEAGTEIVISGQFLIDSETRTRAAVMRMDADLAEPEDRP